MCKRAAKHFGQKEKSKPEIFSAPVTDQSEAKYQSRQAILRLL